MNRDEYIEASKFLDVASLRLTYSNFARKGYIVLIWACIAVPTFISFIMYVKYDAGTLTDGDSWAFLGLLLFFGGFALYMHLNRHSIKNIYAISNDGIRIFTPEGKESLIEWDQISSLWLSDFAQMMRIKHPCGVLNIFSWMEEYQLFCAISKGMYLKTKNQTRG